MKCQKCGISVMDTILQRVNPKGEIGIWWCEPCMKQYEPELYKNTMEDKSPLEHLLEDFVYSKNSEDEEDVSDVSNDSPLNN